jgi:hypothetical protein
VLYIEDREEEPGAAARPFSFSANRATEAPYGRADPYYEHLGYDADDLRIARGSRPRWGLVATVLLVCAGSYFAYDRVYMSSEAPTTIAAPAGAAPVQVIKAIGVPPDTQGPGSAITSDSELTETAGTKVQRRKRGRRRGASGRRAPESRKTHDLTIRNTDDPLEGAFD